MQCIIQAVISLFLNASSVSADCKIELSAYDGEREARACVDRSIDDFAFALKRAGIELNNPNVDWCVTDHNGSRCGDFAAPGQIARMECKGHWDSGGSCGITCGGQEYVCSNGWILYQCMSLIDGGMTPSDNWYWGAGKICTGKG